MGKDDKVPKKASVSSVAIPEFPACEAIWGSHLLQDT